MTLTEEQLRAQCKSASAIPAALRVPKSCRTVKQRKLVEFWQMNRAIIQEKYLTVRMRREIGL